MASELGLDPSPKGTPMVRTARFFLSAGDRRKRGISNDPTLCKEHLGDLAACREKGCPGALDSIE